MKKILLTLLLVFCVFSASKAQSNDRIKTTIFSYLQNECGYETHYDADGDIQFTMDDLIYYVIIKTLDDYSLVEIRIAFESEESTDRLLSIANDFNRSNYLCKCSAEPGSFQISVEFAVSTTVQALSQTGIALQWFPVWIESLQEYI